MEQPNYSGYQPLPEHQQTRGYKSRLQDFLQLRDAADEGSMQGKSLLAQSYAALMRQHEHIVKHG